MRRSLAIFSLLILLSQDADASPSLWERIYVGAAGSLRLDHSQNTAEQLVYKTSFGFGYDASLRIGIHLTDKLFLESGIGRYQTCQTFSLDAGPAWSTSYANYELRTNWLHVPIRAGYVLHNGRAFQFSTLLGCNIIVDGHAAHVLPQPFTEEVLLRPTYTVRGAATTSASGFPFIGSGSDFGAFLYSGFRAARYVGSRLKVHADIGYSLGLRQVRGGTFFFRRTGATKEEYEARYSTFKGDALGVSVGVQYSLAARRTDD